MAASALNATRTSRDTPVYPWDLMPHLAPAPTTRSLTEQRMEAEKAAASGFGVVGVLEDVIIRPRGWQSEE